jgi:hypothetical protein
MKNATHDNWLLLVSALTLATAGCYTASAPKQAFTAYATKDKIPLRVAVNVTEELRQAKGSGILMDTSFFFPIGSYLAQNAPELARHVFVDVVETNALGVPVDAVLTPKLVYSNVTCGSYGTGITIYVKVEWNLTDTSGETIWLETITGQAMSGTYGATLPTDSLKVALEKLLTKSQQAMLSAPAVRQFAMKKSTGASSEVQGP